MLCDSDLVDKFSSAIVDGITNGQRATRTRQGQAAPNDKDTSMMFRTLESMYVWMQILESMRAQLRSLESMRNETHTLDALTSPLNSLLPMKTQMANIQYRLEEVAMNISLVKPLISSCSRHPAKIRRSVHDLVAPEGAKLPCFETCPSSR